MKTLISINAADRHEAQMKAEQAAEALDKAHALANLMNAHTGQMPIAQITAIFACNPPLAAHILCKKVSSHN
ncbi:hypothetical protein BZ17_700 [Yersinia pseudotuberculosis IP 32953]|uniref:hypothetical protein n=1 Tax=Yersinia pseudotuberculosis TaxID=633 RepID=UPI00030E3F04|nr:hypothetical protein [Yersinia pseudotuberculosis]AJJ55164.1 hypothetical protein BZ17_700 [Yersinia pseudotuberculosis IP 32953]KGA61080.1 hypothetical protein DJ55_271 [Yersinia pseudotuberculosis]PSH43212.1 hypothetical protein BA193_12965 [Yersinia pseudotuberculosis]PSH45786.1 hypothetical protein BA194_17920 [Yersinia pseudotuberculosis]CND86761.1 Uncharacterised protein [Yersinia pseudotuberculosis]